MTRIFRSVACAAALGCIAFGAQAEAASLIFQGTATAPAMTFPDGGCTPLPFHGIISPAGSSGASNLGSFTYGHDACTGGTLSPPFGGTFVLDFAGSKLTGLFEGLSTQRIGMPWIFDQVSTYTVTGGTGTFSGASGGFANVGFVDLTNAPPSHLTFNFDGVINVRAVPEPATWAFMVLGIGLVGAAMRRSALTGISNPARQAGGGLPHFGTAPRMTLRSISA